MFFCRVPISSLLSNRANIGTVCYMKYLSKNDPVIAKYIQQEIRRQEEGLEMIASENIASIAVLEALGTPLTDKYSEGYPHKRYYSGNTYIDKIEEEAIERAVKLFNAEHANVQSHSGSDANMAAYLALMNPGDTFLGMNLASGGHLTHGHTVSATGRIFHAVQYGVDKKTELLDFDAIRKIAQECHPKVIVCGATAYPRQMDFKTFSEIAHEVGAKLIADCSHIAGLIIGGVHNAPFPYADVVTTTTHKTLRGPRGAIILCKKEYGKAIDKSVMPGLQGGPFDHVIAAKAVAFGEALRPSFRQYAQQIVKNAHVLAEIFSKTPMRLVTGGTDNHLLLIDVTPLGLTGGRAADILENIGIYVNKNAIPFDTRRPVDPSGIRIGTPSLTTRGFVEEDMRTVGKIIVRALTQSHNEKTLHLLKSEVAALAKVFPAHPELQ